jgi:hypothetical protein
MQTTIRTKPLRQKLLGEEAFFIINQQTIKNECSPKYVERSSLLLALVIDADRSMNEAADDCAVDGARRQVRRSNRYALHDMSRIAQSNNASLLS